MATKTHGILGSADLAATTDTTLYAPGVGRKATVNVNLCNRNATQVTVRIMTINGGSTVGALANGNYIEFETNLPGNGVLERTGICLANGQCVGVRASGTGVSAVAQGIEEDVV